jgi:hypothetical protein
MTPKETNLEVKPGIGIQAWFKRTGDTVFVNSPCVVTEGKILRIGEFYEIHDLTEPEVKKTYIKLLWVYLKGFSFQIISVDISNGDIKLNSHRMNVNELPCPFLICDLLYFEEEIVQRILRTFEEQSQLESVKNHLL